MDIKIKRRDSMKGALKVRISSREVLKFEEVESFIYLGILIGN